MEFRDFAYWLQGYFELTPSDKGLTASQADVIKEHLQLCFRKETQTKVDVDEGGSVKIEIPYYLNPVCWKNSNGECVASC